MLAATVSPGEFISATATDLTTNDTSEFAQNLTAVTSAPTVTLSAGAVSYTVGNPLTDANQSCVTPTYLKTVTGSFALALADMSGSTPADEPLARAVSMDIVDTDTTNARAAVYFC